MKKILIIITSIVILIALGVFTYTKVIKDETGENPKPSSGATAMSSTEGITTVLTLDDEITDNTIWCGTFQLIWNDLKNDLAKQDIVFIPQLKVAENLNKETFTVRELSEKYYYKKIGTPTLKLKEEIEKAIKDKFNEKSDILDDFDWTNKTSEDC